MLRRSLWAVFIVITFCFTTQALAFDVDYYHNGLGYINAVADPPPVNDDYAAGTTVTVTAVAEPGWQFDGWEGAVTGTQTPTSFVVNGNTYVQANFVIIGDVDASGKVDVADSVPALQAAIGVTPDNGLHVGADANGNGKIDAAEAAHALQADAQLRPFQGPETAGAYYNVGMEYDFFGSGPESWMSSLTLDGWGLLEVQDLYTSDGTLESGAAIYFINAEGSITISITDGGAMFQFHGIAAVDSSHYAIANTTVLPGIDFGIKKSTGLSNVVLNGTYLMITFKYEPEPIAMIDRIICNGAGSGTVEELMVSNGTVEPGVFPFNYSVSQDGLLTIWVTPPGEPTFYIYGSISGDGSRFSILEQSTNDIGIGIGIKTSTNAGNGLLNGEYIYAGMEHDTAFWDVGTSRGLLTMDGAGTGTQRNLTVNGPVYPAASPFTYSVNTDGTFTIDTGEGSIDGIVSPDGETMLIGFMASTQPGIAVGIKKSP